MILRVNRVMCLPKRARDSNGCPGKNSSGLDAWGLQEEDPGQFVPGRRSLLKRHWGIMVVIGKLEGQEAGTLSMWCAEKWDLDRMAEPTGNDGLEVKGKAEAKENYRSTADSRDISSDLPWQKESSGWNVRNSLENNEEAATAKWTRSCVSSRSLWLSTRDRLKLPIKVEVNVWEGLSWKQLIC